MIHPVRPRWRAWRCCRPLPSDQCCPGCGRRIRRVEESHAFQPIVAAITRESADYQRPVYLFNGDSHVYNSDRPLAAGSSWLSFYGIEQPVPNLSRITVDGSTGVQDYLRVSVSGHGDSPLTWTRSPSPPDEPGSTAGWPHPGRQPAVLPHVHPSARPVRAV